MSGKARFFSLLGAFFVVGLTVFCPAFETITSAAHTVAPFSQPSNIPTHFSVGDSTVKNGTKGMVGWGEALGKHFLAGAELNAVCVVEGIPALTACPLSKCLVEMDQAPLREDGERREKLSADLKAALAAEASAGGKAAALSRAYKAESSADVRRVVFEYIPTPPNAAIDSF